MLTGKAKEDFLEYCYKNHQKSRLGIQGISDTYLNALIIEWLEGCDKLNGFNSFENIFYREYRKTGFKNRKEATEKAIGQANLTYNKKLKGAD